MISYNQLITVIESFASNHLQVKRFGAEFKEQLPNISTDGKSFPYLFMTPIGTTTGEFIKEIEVEIYCIDRLRKDRENTNDVISDTEQILTDLAVWLEDGQTLVDVVRSYSATPINNATLDYVDGWSQRFKFEHERIAECEIPMTGNSDGISCPDFDYTITDADENVLYSGTIPSGGSLTQEISSSEVTNSEGTVLATILAQDDTQLSDVNNIDSDGSTVPTPAGVAFTCTPASDATLTLNTSAFLTVASGSTTDISLVDQNDSDITPISLTGGTIKVSVGGVTPIGATLMRTGALSSSGTGDDADTKAEGRETDFFTLTSAPLHLDGTSTINITANRFTDTLGGQTYSNNIVLDWSTWNGYTLLAYYRSIFSSSNLNTARSSSITQTIDSFTNWRLPNKTEGNNVMNHDTTQPLNWSPLNISTVSYFWVSTSNASDNSQAYVIVNGGTFNGSIVNYTKGGSATYFIVRTFSLSTSNELT